MIIWLNILTLSWEKIKKKKIGQAWDIWQNRLLFLKEVSHSNIEKFKGFCVLNDIFHLFNVDILDFLDISTQCSNVI